MMISIHPEHPQPRLIAQVVDILRDDGVIAYPTDTTYGIGCSIFSKKGIEKIYTIKQREKKKPFSFICSDLSEVTRYAKVSNFAYKIMKRLLPGPYTFVLDATSIVPNLLVTKQKTVGIRIPDNPVCLALVKALGNPIVTTSANRSGEEPIGDAALIENLDRARVQTPCEPTVEFLAGAPLDNGNVDARQCQLARQHQAGRARAHDQDIGIRHGHQTAPVVLDPVSASPRPHRRDEHAHVSAEVS